MKCPFCGSENYRVTDSRSVANKIRRRRACNNCGQRFTTYEEVEKNALMVRKRNGSLEPYQPEKIRNGIFNAIKKRPVAPELIFNLIEDLDDEFRKPGNRILTTQQIGNAVLNRLRFIDEVAYIRFASVYKEFSNVEGFIAAISDLNTKPTRYRKYTRK